MLPTTPRRNYRLASPTPQSVYGATWPAHRFPPLRSLPTICVNVLDEEQADRCFAFASSSAPKFRVGDWDVGADGAPILKDAAVSMECGIDSLSDAGDHSDLWPG